MKKILLTLFTTIIVVGTSLSQTKQKNTNDKLKFDGLYFAKTGTVKMGDKESDIYTYIRFYADGEVYTQSVNAYAPDKVIKWLGKNGRAERSGTYKISGSEISFVVNNDKSPDKNIEGPMSDTYAGKVMEDNKLFFQVNHDTLNSKEYSFTFVKVE